MYENRKEPVFDMPIPGMGMTHELGARPWQQPPQYANIEDVAQFYLGQMQDEAFIENTLNLLETEMPITMIANAMVTVGNMNGTHTIDVGVLVMPIIMEMIMFAAESNDVDYVTGMERDVDSEVEDTALQAAINRVSKTSDMPIEESSVSDTEDEMAEDSTMPTGLMARRV